MERLKLLAIAAIALLSSTVCQADVTATVGLGKGVFDGHGAPFERAVALGYQCEFSSDLFIRPEAGFFLDNSGKGTSSFWAAPLLILRSVTNSGLETHLGIGPGYLENPDTVLGGHFQFSLEGGIGIVDRDYYVGVAWKHLSSAGFEMPNLGRDFMTVQIRVLKF